MINKLPDDILWHISNFLSVRDSLKLDSSFSEYYNPYAVKIQRWYRKYKKMRDTKYVFLDEEYSKTYKIDELPNWKIK
jgi:hypothetical protein